MAAETFSGMVLRFRGRTGRSQRAVADTLHTHVRSVQLWEAGDSHPNARNLQGLIRFFVDTGAFTEGQEQMEAAALWDAVEAESDRLRVSFDERWFAALLAEPSTDAAELRQAHHWGGAPDLSGFLGREAERECLRQWLQDPMTRVVAVVGMGGIGKTLLGARAAVDVSLAFDRVCWRSLRDAPPFDDWLSETLRLLSPAAPRHEAATGPEQLLDVMRESQCLLVLDNFESLLEPGSHSGRYRPGYEPYGALLDELAHTPHRGRLLLTSREQPPELGPLKGQAAQVLVLSGLRRAESQALLHDRNLSGDRDAWDALVERCAGNPLALKLASASIRDLFGGDVAAYVADLDLGPGAVFGGARKLLDAQLQRLSGLEHLVLRLLAVEREPVSFADLATGIPASFRRRDAREAVEALLRRALLERTDARDASTFALHPVVLEYISEKLVEEVADEVAADQLTALRARPLMKAMANEYVRESQERTLGSPILERLQRGGPGGRAGVERHLHRQLELLRALPLEEQGYGPGNVANLLRLANGRLDGIDLSRLSVRQACLHDVSAADANLAGAHLGEVLLAEPFDFSGRVAFSADGQQLAVGTTGGDVCVWRLDDRMLQTLATGPAGAGLAVAISADGRHLASGGLDGAVRVWDAASGACLAIGRGQGRGVRSIAMSADGRLLVSGGEDGLLCLWDGTTAVPLSTVSAHPSGVASVAVSGDGDLVASCGVDGVVRLWNGRTCACLATMNGQGGRHYGVTLSRDGQLAIAAGVDGTLEVWETASGKWRGALQGHSGIIQSVASSRDGRVVASVGADGTLILWDAVSMSRLAAWRPHLGGVRGVGLTDAGDLVASVGDDGTICVWRTLTRRVVAIVNGRTGWQRDVALSPDGSCLVGAGSDGRVQVWDAASGARAVSLRGHSGGVWAAALSDDSRQLATGGDDGTIRLWTLPEGECRAVLLGHEGLVWRVAMSGDASQIASSGLDGSVRLWTGDGAAVGALQAHTGGVRALAMSADGSVLVSGGLDGAVKVWRPAADMQPTVLDGHTGLVRAVSVNGDGTVIASGAADGTVRLWFSLSGPSRITLQGLNGIRAVALSRDGAVLATGGDDGVLCLWSSSSGARLGETTGHTGGIWGVAVSGDGRSIATGGADGVVRLWGGPALLLQHEFRADRPYERMDITGLTGVSSAQRQVLVALGAVETFPNASPNSYGAH